MRLDALQRHAFGFFLKKQNHKNFDGGIAARYLDHSLWRQYSEVFIDIMTKLAARANIRS